jgi:hypothetical protein
MMQEDQTSYKDLPKRYYEFAELYSVQGGKVVNEAGLYMTIMCEPDKINDEAASLYAFIVQHVGNKQMRQGKHGIKVGVAPAGELQYVSSSNAKADAGLILTRVRLYWHNPGE